MTTKICLCCEQPFQPRPQVQNQTYCSSPACQRERRQAWQRKKLQDDHFYRENQQDAQRAWRQRNPQYSRNYRATNPQTMRRNWYGTVPPSGFIRYQAFTRNLVSHPGYARK